MSRVARILVALAVVQRRRGAESPQLSMAEAA